MVPDVPKARIAHISGSLGREWEGNTILRNPTFRKGVLPTLADLSVVNVNTILRNQTFRKRVLPTLADLSVVNEKAILYSETRRFESAYCPH